MINALDYIRVYKKTLSLSFCKFLISKATENENDWCDAGIVKGPEATLDPTFRSVKIFKNINKVYKTKKGREFNFDPFLYKVVNSLLTLYKKKFAEFEFASDEGYQLLKYLPGGFYKNHTDAGPYNHRSLSIIFMCNDNFKGGDLRFMDRYNIEMGVGDAVLFPSNFLFPHQVTPVTEGARYTIASFCN